MNEELSKSIEEMIVERTGQSFRIRGMDASHGGCIHQSGVCSDGERQFFIKRNSADCLGMFEAEANGLAALAESQTLRVPEVIGVGVASDQAFLVLEALDLSGSAPVGGWETLGRQLAAMHRMSGETYGWERDNFIGNTAQSNQCHRSWAAFFIEERLKPQLALARCNGHSLTGEDRFLDRAGELLADHRPVPSLLHGDLWSGNVGFTVAGDPVLYDPAVFHGDHECDLAFSEYFGGFSPEFYRAYREVFPVAAAYAARRDLYNVYHVLNHANLFGGGYIRQAQVMMDEVGS